MNGRMRLAVGLVALLGGLLVSSVGHAGYDAEYRNSCNTLPKFKLRGHIYYANGFHQSVQYNTDRGCSFAAIDMYSQDLTSARISKRIGSSPYYYHYTANSHWSTGRAFLAPASFGPDSLGIARNTLTAVVDVTPATFPATGTTITLHNFSGGMWARAGTPFGTSYRCIAWNAANFADSVVTPTNLLSDNSVRIDNGVVHTTGLFSASDFTVSTLVDSTGYTVVRVLPNGGLTKTITLSADDTNNTVALSEFGDVGYGTYDPSSVFLDSQAFPAGPGLEGVGMVVVCGLLLASGLFVLARRRSRMGSA